MKIFTTILAMMFLAFLITIARDMRECDKNLWGYALEIPSLVVWRNHRGPVLAGKVKRMNYKIEQMTAIERNKFVYKFKSLRGHWTLWKLWTEGQWHYGFLSEEQAKWAMEHRSTVEESYYVKDDVRFEPASQNIDRATVYF
jgi:hypothetical protein